MTEPMKTEDQELLDLSNKYREEQYPQIAIGKDLATAVTAALHCQAGFIAGYKAGKISGVAAEREMIIEKMKTKVREDFDNSRVTVLQDLYDLIRES